MTVLSLLIALSASAIAAFTDIRRYKVYNALTFPLAGAGLLYHAVAPSGMGWGYAGSGLLAGFLLLIILYAIGILGAGDVKFAAAIGAWLGPDAILRIVLIGCMATGVYSAVVIFGRGGVKAIARNVWLTCRSACMALIVGQSAAAVGDYREMAKQSDRRQRLVPFSAMQAIGVVYVAMAQMSGNWPTWF